MPAADAPDGAARMSHHVFNVIGAKKCHIESRRHVEPVKRQDDIPPRLQRLERRERTDQALNLEALDQFLCLGARLRRIAAGIAGELVVEVDDAMNVALSGTANCVERIRVSGELLARVTGL